jgi:hypothetical protein
MLDRLITLPGFWIWFPLCVLLLACCVTIYIRITRDLAAADPLLLHGAASARQRPAPPDRGKPALFRDEAGLEAREKTGTHRSTIVIALILVAASAAAFYGLHIASLPPPLVVPHGGN